MELSVTAPAFPSWPPQSHVWAEGCFSPLASFLGPVTEILQSFIIFNHLYYPEDFCIMTKPCHFTVYSFPVNEWVCKQTAHTSRGHHCCSASTTRPDHELPLSVSCFFNSFLFNSSRDLSIYALTFLKSLWWEMLSAALRKYKLVISTGYPLSKGLLTPPENSRDYGRTSFYKSHSDFHSTSQLPLHPIIPFFFFCCFLQKQQHNTNLFFSFLCCWRADSSC